MSSISRAEDQYIDLRNNGRLFPTWVLHNFKKYKLPKIIRAPGEDPCKTATTKPSGNEKLRLRQYQEFMGAYLDPHGPYNEILLYHGLGSGKTAASINLLNIMYNYDHNINVIICIKASLHTDPWMADLKKFLETDPSEEGMDMTKTSRYATIRFVHYDSPFADKEFMEMIKKLDTSRRTMYVIDEVHNFIRNVYSNIQAKTGGKRAQVIYDYIIKDRNENRNNKLVLISATPGINVPYELALLFNMLRPGSLPSSESEFNRMFIMDSSYPILSPQKKNLFQRRIMGLVSYYIGSTPDLFAEQKLEDINLVMSAYQYGIYNIFENIETKLEQKARRFGKSSQLYRTYTRQASNFVFPYVNSKINGEQRPRPNAFRLSEKIAQDVLRGAVIKSTETTADTETDTTNSKEYIKKYIQALETYVSETEKYFQRIHSDAVKAGQRTIFDDLNEFIKGFNTTYKENFKNFFDADGPRSELFVKLYDSSPKMLAIVFTTAASPGKVMIYTNYVIMEGIDMLKVYFRLVGFNDYRSADENKGYCEYHGRMDKGERDKVKDYFNQRDNIRGTKCRVILLSPSATEGIQLLGIRQEHILEPYFTEVRISQVIGRGIRFCSHVDLPMAERTVKIYRYKVIKPDFAPEVETELGIESEPIVKSINPKPIEFISRLGTDEIIEDIAKAKDNLIQSFLSAMKEVAIDCELFQEHNMMSQSYHCFKFPESSIMKKHVGPAYKEDIKDDIKYDSGLNAPRTRVDRIKVIKIQAVHLIGPEPYNPDQTDRTFSKPDKYWYYQQSGMVYDYETHYPVGYIQTFNSIPPKLDKDTYIITDVIKIPTLISTKNL